jgi:superfamily II DNA or RNA helicase
MASLLVKELLIRGDLERCLVVAPGNLVEQWQDELAEKFHLEFAILTRDRIEASRTGNPFDEARLWIARLDMLSRNEDLQAKLLAAHEWDLVICDEAHRMSAAYFGGEVKYSKRYQLGQRLSGRARHFLLMTATPHSGKEADFQLFMAELARVYVQLKAGEIEPHLAGRLAHILGLLISSHREHTVDDRLTELETRLARIQPNTNPAMF